MYSCLLSNAPGKRAGREAIEERMLARLSGSGPNSHLTRLTPDPTHRWLRQFTRDVRALTKSLRQT